MKVGAPAPKDRRQGRGKVGLLRTHKTFERHPVLDEQGRTVERHKVVVLELAQRTRDRLPRTADDLADFFVRQGERHANALRCRLALGRPVEQEAPEFLRRRLREPQRADLLARRVVAGAQLLRRMDRSFSVLAEITQEVLASDVVDLAGFEHLRRGLVRCAGDRGVQTQNFPRLGNAQNDGLSLAGGNGDLDAAPAEHEDAPWRLPLDKEDGTFRIRGRILDGLERFECGGRQIAKETLRPHFAIATAFGKVQTVRRTHASLPQCACAWAVSRMTWSTMYWVIRWPLRSRAPC